MIEKTATQVAKQCDQAEHVRDLVKPFYSGCEYSTMVWMGKKNPILGGLSPMEVIDNGRGADLLTILGLSYAIKDQYARMEESRKVNADIIKNINLVQTCSACPEQYDAFHDGKAVGYLRLRHGNFTVQCPDATGDVVLDVSPAGDSEFEDGERKHFLSQAMHAIAIWIAQQPKEK